MSTPGPPITRVKDGEEAGQQLRRYLWWLCNMQWVHGAAPRSPRVARSRAACRRQPPYASRCWLGDVEEWLPVSHLGDLSAGQMWIVLAWTCGISLDVLQVGDSELFGDSDESCVWSGHVTPSWPSGRGVVQTPGAAGIPRTEKPPSHSITTPVVAAAFAREASWT